MYDLTNLLTDFPVTHNTLCRHLEIQNKTLKLYAHISVLCTITSNYLIFSKDQSILQ